MRSLYACYFSRPLRSNSEQPVTKLFNCSRAIVYSTSGFFSLKSKLSKKMTLTESEISRADLRLCWISDARFYSVTFCRFRFLLLLSSNLQCVHTTIVFLHIELPNILVNVISICWRELLIRGVKPLKTRTKEDTEPTSDLRESAIYERFLVSCPPESDIPGVSIIVSSLSQYLPNHLTVFWDVSFVTELMEELDLKRLGLPAMLFPVSLLPVPVCPSRMILSFRLFSI